MNKKLLVLNGPNLNLLGKREIYLYGSGTLAELEKNLLDLAQNFKVDLEFFQTSSEGEMVQKVHQSYDLIIINPAAFTHTSIALRDAFLGTQTPFIEVHLTNLYNRAKLEPFRGSSYLADLALGVISGFGLSGYYAAFSLALEYLFKPALQPRF